MRSYPRSTLSAFLAAAAALSSPTASAADITRLDNTTTLNLSGAWTNGTTNVTVGTTDVAVFTGAYNTAGSLSAAFGGNSLSWGGIRIGSLSGTAAGLVSIGGTGNAVAASALTIGSSGIDLSGANQNLVINAATINLNASQTFNIGTGRNIRFGTTGTGSANANVDGNNANAVITISGSGVFDANQGGGSGFADAAGYAGFSGKWVVESGATLRGLRNGATAWGSNTAADTILLKGGTLADGGITGANGDWTWTTNITLAAGTSSVIDNQIPSGTDRYLKLNGAITSADSATTLTFRETTNFSNIAKGFVITNNNANLQGTVNIGTGTGNGVNVRVGGVSGNDSTMNASTTGGLGTAAVVIGTGSTLTLSRSSTWEFANSISGAGTLHIGGAAGALITGTGTQVVTLSGTNSYSGGTELVQGTLKVAEIGKIGIGYLAIKLGATFEYTGAGSETSTRAIWLDNGAATINVSDANAVLTLNPTAGSAGATGASFAKSGAGTLVFGGALGASTNQTVAVSAGRLRLTAANTFTGAVTISGGTLELSGAGSLGSGSYAGAIANAGALEFTGSATQALSGAITGTGSLSRSGSGTLTLSNTGNTFTGGTTVSNGTLALGAAGVLADGGAVAVSGGAFDLGGFAETVGTVTLSGGTIQNGTLTSNADYAVSGGTIAANAILSGAVGLNKTGAGSATINGTQAYTGATTVSNGTLSLGAGATLASTSIVIGNGATLSTADGLTLGTGRTLSLGSGTSVVAANKSGNLTFGGGVLAIDFGTSTNDLLAVSGDITITSGSIAFAKAGAYTGGTYDLLTYGGTLTGSASSLTLSGLSSDGTSRQTFNLVHEEVAKKLQLVIGGQAENVVWSGAADGIWAAGGSAPAGNWAVTDPLYAGDQPSRFFNGDTVVFGDGASTGNVQIDVAEVTPGSVTVNAETLDYAIGGIGVIASGALTKSGAATLTLAGANTYTGGTTLSAGRIRLGANNALGSGAIAISGGALSSDGTTARSLSNAVNLTGDVTLGDATNSGELTLSGAIDLGAATRTLTAASNAVLSGAISNGGNLVKAGAGKVTFTGTNVLRTGLDVTAGTAALGASNAINDAVSVTVRSGATLDLAGFSETLANLTLESGASVTAGTLTATTVTVGGTTLGASLVGSTALVKNGTGILDLTAASTRSGSTTLSAGGIRVADNAALGTGSLALNGGTLTADATARTLANATTIGGNVTLGEAGAGLLTFSSALNLGGASRTVTTASSVRFSGAVSNGSLTKAGNGTLTLSGAGSMTSTSIQAGRIEMVGTVNSLGTGSVALTDGAELALSMSAANVTVGNVFTGTGRIAKNTTNRFFISGDNSNAVIEWYWASNDPAGPTGGLGFSNGAAFGGAGSKITVASGITASAFINATGQTAAIGLDIASGGTYQWNGSTGNTNTFTGVISGAGTFTKISGETLLATGVHTHTGAFNVNSGTFQVAQSGRLGSGDFIGALSIAGTFYYNSDAAQTLSGIVSGAGALRKGNTSTLVLSGANTLTGQTLVEQGTVRLTGSQTGASNTNKVVNVATVAGQSAAYEVAGGNLSLTGTNSLIIGDLGTGTFTLSSGTVSLGSGGVWIGDAAATAVGTLDIQGGTFASSGGLVVGTRGTGFVNITGGSASFGSISLGHSAGTGQSATVNLGAVTVTTGSIIGQAAATTRNLFLDGTTLRASGASATFLQGLTTAQIASDRGVTFDTNGFDITVAQDLGAVAEDGGIDKVGVGTLTLSGTNLHSGGTRVAAGTLRAGSAGAFGSGAVTLTGGTLDLGSQTIANDVTLAGGSLAGSGEISGTVTAASGLTMGGAGTLTLSGTNAIASVAINQGTLVAGSSGALGSGTVTLAGGTLDVGGQTLANAIVIQSGAIAGIGTLSGSISGAGNLAKSGAGVLELSGSNSYAATTVSDGTLRLSGSGTLGVGAVTVSGGTLDLNGVSLSKDITLSGGTLAGASALSGTVTVTEDSAASGTVGANLALGTADARVLDITGGLIVTGSLSGVGTLANGALTIEGTHNPGNSPGYQLIDGDLTYSDGSTLLWEFDDSTNEFADIGVQRPTIGNPGNHDAIDVTGDLIISPGAILQLSALFAAPELAYAHELWSQPGGVTFQAIRLTGDGTVTGMFQFANGTQTLDADGLGIWTIRRENLDFGESTGIYLTYSAIPEPSTYGLILGGLALAGAAIRRRRAKRLAAGGTAEERNS